MTFDDFIAKLTLIEKNAPNQHTRDLAKSFMLEIGNIIYIRDEKEAESFLKLFA